MIEVQYIVSTILIIFLAVFFIAIIYMIRSNMSITKGPYNWISSLCIFSMFLIVIMSLFLGLAYTSPMHLGDSGVPPKNPHYIEGMNSLEYKFLIMPEFSSVFSLFISKYALFPLLVGEAIIYVCLNSRLLWIWYITGEWDTIVNKFIFLQRIWGIIYMVGCVVDFWIRLYGLDTVTFMSMDTNCSCWMIFYKFLFYAIMTSQFAIAVLRIVCVSYPIEYHNRSVNKSFEYLF